MTVAPTPVHRRREKLRPSWIVLAILAFLVGGLTVALLYRYDVLGSSSAGTAKEGSGVSATQAREVPAFTRLELAGSNNVVIRVGEKQSVLVRADDNLLDEVTTEVRSGALVVGNTAGSFTTKSPMVVEVTVPTLDALLLTGNGNIAVGGIDAESFEVALPGSGTLTGEGTATRLDVTVGGSGTVQFTRLATEHAKALVSGSGSVFVTATESLDATVSGSGAIIYTGSPSSVTKRVSGSGVITGS